MPPRALSRPPFAGIGSGTVQFPSPERPSSRLGGASTRSTSHSPTKHHISLTSQVHTPTADPPIALHHLSTPIASTAGVDYTLGSSAVSESISRAYFYDVVLEADSTSASFDQDQPGIILPWLGSVIVDQTGSTDEDHADHDMPRSASGSSINAVASDNDRMRSDSGPSKPGHFDLPRFQGRVQELLDTERSYIRRIEALHTKYAMPLRKLAKDRDTAIIPIYEAQRLFGNIGEIVGANQAFLNDLEALIAKGTDAIRRGLGDVVYRHMSCFSCYTEYFANFEKAKHIERTLAKHRGFQEFTDRTKYSMTGLGNVGLRDLLMEPVQRIPRYKLLLDGVIKYMDARDPQKGRLEDAVVLASRIASCEADDKTKRAAVLWSFNRIVEDFPAGLISVHREFIDCIDVDDFPLEALGAPAGVFSPGASVSPSGKTIHCTLFLFDDRLAIVKRASPSICGRKAVGLDDLNKLADQMKTFTERSSNALPSGGKRGDLGFRGVVNIMDVEALDLGGSDFQLNFLRPPGQTSGDKWSGRPVRQYVTSDTGSVTQSIRGPRSFDNDMPARLEKTRFLESLWRARALFKTKEHRSHVRCQVLPAVRPQSDSVEHARPALDGETIAAREAEARRVIYWNVYTRRSYLSEPHKAPLVLHVNFHGESDPLPFGPEAIPPHAALQVVHVDDSYGECQVSTLDKLHPEEPSDVTVVQCGDLSRRMAQLAAETNRLLGGRMTLYTVSQPITPSSHRTRMAAGLEQFGRSLLFGGGSPGGLDVFGSPARRTKSNASKSTAYSSDAPSTSSRAMTFSTAATSVSSRAGMLESVMTGTTNRNAESPDGGFLASPRRLMKKRRSSSVGPPSMAAERSPSRGPHERTAGTRGPTPEPGYLSTEDAVHPAERAASPFGLRSSRLGMRDGHQRAKTESCSTPFRSPMFDASDYQARVDAASGADVSREASTSTRSSTSRHGRTLSNVGMSLPNRPIRATTPLNIRRKPPPRAEEDEDEEEDGPSPVRRDAVLPSSFAGAEPLSGRRRTPSGTKRLLSSDATPTSSKPWKRASTDTRPGDEQGREPADDEQGREPAGNEGEDPAPGRPSLSESETSTERGHGVPRSPNKVDGGDGQRGIPKRSTSSVSRQRGVEEARKRSRAVEDSVRGIKEEVKRLRLDLGSGTDTGDDENARTPRRRSVQAGAMQETTLNLHQPLKTGRQYDVASSADRLTELTTELEVRLASSMRMHERLLAQLSNGGPSTTGTAVPVSPATERELSALRAQVSILTRKCELLTTLETDGRMENTELHKAFNEELDRMYDDAQRPESAELAALRDEIKRVKRQRNEASVRNKKLQCELELEKTQSGVYREMLEETGLL